MLKSYIMNLDYSSKKLYNGLWERVIFIWMEEHMKIKHQNLHKFCLIE